jgi:hypothetical protein
MLRFLCGLEGRCQRLLGSRRVDEVVLAFRLCNPLVFCVRADGGAEMKGGKVMGR